MQRQWAKQYECMLGCARCISYVCVCVAPVPHRVPVHILTHTASVARASAIVNSQVRKQHERRVRAPRGAAALKQAVKAAEAPKQE